MNEHWTDRLSEYLDGELPDSERAVAEQHLASCPECQELLDDLRVVKTQAASLPSSQPAHDLWPGIAERIGRSAMVRPISTAPSKRRISFSMPQLAAAAVLVAVCSGGFAWLVRGELRPAATPAQPIAAAPAPSRSLAARAVARQIPGPSTPSYASAVSELEQVLAEHRGQLDSTTVRVLEQNLAVINQAVADAQAALARDPQNGYLSTHLARTMRQKVALLRQAASLAAQS